MRQAWSAVNSSMREDVMTPFDFLLLNLASAFRDSPPGLIVCSSDVLLEFGKVKKADWTRPGVTGLGIPMPIDYGTRHGVFIGDENGYVAFVIKIFQWRVYALSNTFSCW